MLPDIITPVQCPTCGAEKSHEALGLLIHGCVYQCGAAYASDASGHVYPALVCRKALGIIDQLRADNARLGAMNVAMAAELQAIADTAAKDLGPLLLMLHASTLAGMAYTLRAIYDLATEALEGRAPAAAESEKVTA